MGGSKNPGAGDEDREENAMRSDDSTDNSVKAHAGRITSERKRRRKSDPDESDQRTDPSKLRPKSSSEVLDTPGAGQEGAKSGQYSATEITLTIDGVVKTYVKMPGYKDVLLGRGRGIQTANGNYLMRQIIAGHRNTYCSLMRQDRRKYSETVLNEVLATGARFLQRTEHNDTEYWVPVDRETAHDKVSHSLREKRPSREHNIGDPIPQDHPSALPDVTPSRRRTTSSRAATKDSPANMTSSLQEQNTATSIVRPMPAFPVPVQQGVPRDVAATTVLLLQAIQSQAQQQQLISSMVQSISQMQQHTIQPSSFSPQLDLTSQLSQLQSIAALNSRSAIPGPYLMGQLQSPLPAAFNVSLPTILPTILAAQQQQGYVQNISMPAAGNLSGQLTRSTHQTVVGQASLNTAPNHQTSYASSMLLHALVALNQTIGDTQGNITNSSVNNGSSTGDSGDSGGGRFEQL